MKNGWKPRRTLFYASWDAEEYGLVGSTEWAEEHAKEIDQKAVLMLNVDSAVSGHELSASGVPSLRDLMLDAAESIVEPRTGKALRSIWIEAHRAAWAERAARAERPGLGLTPGYRSLQWQRGTRAVARLRSTDGLARVGIGLHSVRRSPWRAGCRHRLSRQLWGLSLDLR